MMKSIMVAVGDNQVIGKDNGLVWHLPADLKYFKETTMGHWVIMGRKTFESFGNPLHGRPHIVITRNPDYQTKGHRLAASLQQAFEIAAAENEKEVFVLGGGEIYKHAVNMVDMMYVTEVHGTFEGDTFFPEIDLSVWQEVSRKDFSADNKNKYAYSFVIYRRRGTGW